MLTQKQIAEIMAVTQPVVSQLFTGRRKIGPATAQKIAAFTGQPWQQYVHMPGHELKKVLQESYLTKVAK